MTKALSQVAAHGEWKAHVTARAYGANAKSEWSRGKDWVKWYLLSLKKSLDYSRRARAVRVWRANRW